MLRPTPFHARTSALNHAYAYKDWNGYAAVCRYDTHSEAEYFAFRHRAGLIDVSPLRKYEVTGEDAAAFLSRIMTRDIERIAVGRVTYCCLVDAHGKALDDCTVGRLSAHHYRVSASEAWLDWFQDNARGLDVGIEDSSDRIAALALQGPRARAILKPIVEFDMDRMRFFRVRRTILSGIDVTISRTGYTGDLGYEIWCDADKALDLWDALMQAGADHGITPAGLDALDVVRIEAGFVLQGIDYFCARSCMIESRKSSPYEMGLGWTVDLDRRVAMVGQQALEREAAQGSEWALVGLELDWAATERLYDSYGLPPHLAPEACRLAVPVFDRKGRQVGQATSTTWSPVLKRYLALATVKSTHAASGTQLLVEHTVEFERRTLPALVVEKPFFDPPRKRFTPGLAKAKNKAAK